MFPVDLKKKSVKSLHKCEYVLWSSLGGGGHDEIT